MSSIDERVVSMKFDNKDFEKNVKTTMSTLDKLKEALDFGTSKKGVTELQKATDNFDASKMAESVETISSKFSALGAIGFTIIQDLTREVLDFSKRVLSGLLDPIFEGGKDRALKIEQAKFQFRGLGQDVEKSMASALEAVKGTAYGLDAAAAVAAQFGATGMKAGAEMTGALRGVAGMAAMTGRSYEEIGSIFTTIAGEGKLSTMRMQQFATRGVNVAAKLADQMGITEAQVRQLVSQGKISFQEFAKYMDDAFGEHATKANETYTGSVANMRAALSRIGASFQIPKMEAMRKVFNALTPVIDDVHEALGPAIDQFTKLTEFAAGKTIARLNSINLTGLKFAIPPALAGFKNILVAIGQVLGTVKDAFTDIFTAPTSIQILKMAQGFKNFTDNLKMGAQTTENLKRTFRGFFAVLDIGWQIFKGVLSLFGSFLGASSGAAGGILGFTGSVGDMLVALDEAIKKGDFLTGFFRTLGGVLSIPVQLISWFGQVLRDAFSNFDPSILGKISDGFGEIGDAVSQALQSNSFDSINALLGTGLLGGIFVVLKRFKNMLESLFDGGILGRSGLLGGLKDTFDTLTGSLEAMQTQIQAKTLLLIASALGVLALSVVALSMVDAKNLAKSLSAMTVAFTQLLGAMAILVKISGSAGFIQVPAMAAAMVLLSTSLLILVGAITLMSKLSWAEIGKGLAGIAGALLMISAAMRLMPKGMLAQAAAIVALSVALNLMATAIALMGSMSWEKMVKGLLGLASTLMVVAAAMSLMPKNMLLQALALVAVGAALNLFALAIAGLGSMGWESIAKGLVALGGALLILAVGLNAMSGGTVLGALALAVAAKGLLALAGALVIMGTMSWSTILRSLTALAASFVVLGAAGYILAPIVPAMLGLGLSLLALGAALALAGVGMAAFAVAFTTFATAGSAGIAVMLSMLKGVIELVPFALQQLAEGLVAFTLTLAENAPEMIQAFAEIMLGVLAAIDEVAPAIMETFAGLVLALITQLADSAPQFLEQGVRLVINIMTGITRQMGKLISTATDLVVEFIREIGRNSGRIVNAGFELIIDFINGLAKAIRKNRESMYDAGKNLAKEIINGMIYGLKRFGGDVAGAAKNVAQSALNSAKNFLGIGSPSKEFIDVGYSSDKGLAIGLEKNANLVAKASENVAASALTPIQKAMANLADYADADMNINPTIRPVLDLSDVQAKSKQIGALLDTAPPLDVSDSYNSAAAIAMQEKINKSNSDSSDDKISVEPSVTNINYIQNNNSPKALSESEIYRQTKNQLSTVKEALPG